MTNALLGMAIGCVSSILLSYFLLHLKTSRLKSFPWYKERMAESVAETVQRQLLNEATLKDLLLSDQAISVVRSRAEQFLGRFENDERSIQDALTAYVSKEALNDAEISFRTSCVNQSTKKLIEADIGSKAMAILSNKFEGHRLAALINNGLKNTISNYVNSTIADNVPNLLDKEIKRLDDGFLNTPIERVYALYQKKFPSALDYVMATYLIVVKKGVVTISNASSIKALLINRITALKTSDFERTVILIIGAWGAILGLVVGLI